MSAPGNTVKVLLNSLHEELTVWHVETWRHYVIKHKDTTGLCVEVVCWDGEKDGWMDWIG